MSAVSDIPYYCPVNNNPLTEAVTLMNCCHRINESAAIKLFGSIKSNGRCEKKKRCPVCTKIVTRYSVDHAYRELVSTAISVISQSSKAEEAKNEFVDLYNVYIESIALDLVESEPDLIYYPQKIETYIPPELKPLIKIYESVKELPPEKQLKKFIEIGIQHETEDKDFTKADFWYTQALRFDIFLILARCAERNALNFRCSNPPSALQYYDRAHAYYSLAFQHASTSKIHKDDLNFLIHAKIRMIEYKKLLMNNKNKEKQI